MLMQFHYFSINTTQYISITTNINIFDVIFTGIIPQLNYRETIISCAVIWFLSSNRSLHFNKIQQLDAGIFSNMAQLREL